MTQQKKYLTATQIPDILESLKIDFKYKAGTYSFACPVHDGDNASACTIFEGRHDIPNWQCWTHQCQNTYGKGLFGFIRGVLSYRSGHEVDFKAVNDFLKNKNLDSFISVEKKPASQQKILTRTLSIGSNKTTKNVDRDYIRKNLTCPSPYFLGRGFSPETLDLFDVGDCIQPGRMMHERAVVPVYDVDNSYAGCCGRTTVNNKDKWIYSFNKGNFLYGLNISLNYIQKSGSAIIVEGNPDLWEVFTHGFRNVVAIMGTAFTDEQLLLLEQSGALDLVILTDMDSAGRKCAESIVKKCGRRFNYHVPEYDAKDPGELGIEIKNILNNYIDLEKL